MLCCASFSLLVVYISQVVIISVSRTLPSSFTFAGYCCIESERGNVVKGQKRQCEVRIARHAIYVSITQPADRSRETSSRPSNSLLPGCYRLIFVKGRIGFNSRRDSCRRRPCKCMHACMYQIPAQSIRAYIDMMSSQPHLIGKGPVSHELNARTVLSRMACL